MDEGSIKLILVRDGESEEGFTWAQKEGRADTVYKRDTREPKTKEITIHTSGRINYHFSDRQVRYIPCLMDLCEPIPIIGYSVPQVALLDSSTRKSEDWVGEAEFGESRLLFTFWVMPAAHEPLNGECGRFGVEGLYALGWTVSQEDPSLVPAGIPDMVFTTLRPKEGLPHQMVTEPEIFLRFKRAMYANDVNAAVEASPDRSEMCAEHIEAMIEQGPGLYPPNKEGVWTLLTRVPMRVAPNLFVEFENPRYKAEVVDLKPGDTRLATVRVRFVVKDEETGAHIKTPVTIRRIALDAEL
ncbi:hypothetical protein [Pusillimonas noertemannii]|nr:hypothetical protein [Pusillimonas noertemannii]NYT67171.1 hypothetical protein [Pusillimonas noertemannii]TFL12627.1 hypothetical protein CSC72_05905 [Pusillimonas noertemannii]